ncbi:hypothetical protein F5Y01DRAFT_285804 [Xylaria sp. FL0043]|nr:hypothetical protein F5Y01DRAFT_285804 [Xylaria sp. FL0043]
MSPQVCVASIAFFGACLISLLFPRIHTTVQVPCASHHLHPSPSHKISSSLIQVSSAALRLLPELENGYTTR